MTELHYLDTGAMAFQADARFPGISIKLLEGRETHPTTSVVLVRVEAGGGIGAHTHPIEFESAYVLSGEAKLVTATAEYPMTPGIFLTIPAGTEHYLVNTGDQPLELFAFHSPPTR